MFNSLNTTRKYIIGNTYGSIEKSNKEIKRSTYCPNITRNVYKYLIKHPNANNLYLLGVKYIDEKGGDIQAGISETRHYNESPIDNAQRGIIEELHISCKSKLALFNKNYNHFHYMLEIIDTDEYTFVDIDNIHPDPSKDDKINKGKASVYVFGTLEVLLPILEKFQPPNGPPHDPIDFLCLVPFSDLKNF